MSEPLLLKSAPPEVEALLRWAESYKGEQVEPSDTREYSNAADVLDSLNRYLVEIEVAERRRLIESLMRQIGEAARLWLESVAFAWDQAMKPVFARLKPIVENIIAEQRRQAVEIFESLQPIIDESERRKEIQTGRRQAFIIADRRHNPVRQWQQQRARIQSQSRINPRRMTRTGVRQIIRK
jgi:hypothetical protein